MTIPDHTDLAAPRHNGATRLFHANLALAIVTQLSTSLWMHGPDDVQAGDILFQVHRYAGLTATVLAFALWLTILFRSRGTQLGALIPWFSGQRLAALWLDTKSYVVAALKLRLPAHDAKAALPSAVHGLGLLLISAMAASGAVYFIQVALGLHSAEPDGMLAMTVHLALANLVWAYLIAHAGLALLQHLLRSMSLSQMWSLQGR
jgi:cytochrome b561